MTFNQKTGMPEEDVKVASCQLNGFIASKCFIPQGIAKICQVFQAGKIF
jgi:hypothetical protein